MSTRFYSEGAIAYVTKTKTTHQTVLSCSNVILFFLHVESPQTLRSHPAKRPYGSGASSG